MRFSVPQFIDVEDKIFGPLSFRQFAYLTGGAGLSYLLYTIIPSIFFAILAIIPVASFAIALAFVKINEKPFIDTVEAAIRYFLGEKLYLWKRSPPRKKNTDVPVEQKTNRYVPALTESKLHDISWGLDVLSQKRSE
jgi:hypothetical protein